MDLPHLDTAGECLLSLSNEGREANYSRRGEWLFSQPGEDASEIESSGPGQILEVGFWHVPIATPTHSKCSDLLSEIVPLIPDRM